MSLRARCQGRCGFLIAMLSDVHHCHPGFF